MLSGLKGSSNCSDIKYPANCSSRVNGNGMEASEKVYEPKQDKKFVRCVTVIAYVFSVSFGAILLSLYYIFIWNPYSNKAGLIQLTTTTTSTTVKPFHPSTKSFVDQTKEALQSFEEAEKFLRTMSNREEYKVEIKPLLGENSFMLRNRRKRHIQRKMASKNP